LTVGNNNADTTFAGQLLDSGSLHKVGSGTLTLSGSSNGYSGATTVSGGKLLFTASYTAGTRTPASSARIATTPARSSTPR